MHGFAKSAAAVVIAGFVGLGLGVVAQHRWNLIGNGSASIEYDHNEDGTPDLVVFYDRGFSEKSKVDRNFDGKWDFWETHERGRLVAAESDDDFDGKVDGWISYTNGQMLLSKYDLDGNGVADLAIRFHNSIPVTGVCRPNGSTNNVRIEFYKHSIVSKEYFDADGDGLLEQFIEYDKFGNLMKQTKLEVPVGPMDVTTLKQPPSGPASNP